MIPYNQNHKISKLTSLSQELEGKQHIEEEKRNQNRHTIALELPSQITKNTIYSYESNWINMSELQADDDTAVENWEMARKTLLQQTISITLKQVPPILLNNLSYNIAYKETLEEYENKMQEWYNRFFSYCRTKVTGYEVPYYYYYWPHYWEYDYAPTVNPPEIRSKFGQFIEGYRNIVDLPHHNPHDSEENAKTDSVWFGEPIELGCSNPFFHIINEWEIGQEEDGTVLYDLELKIPVPENRNQVKVFLSIVNPYRF